MAALLDQAASMLLDQAGAPLLDQAGTGGPVNAATYPVQAPAGHGGQVTMVTPFGTAGDTAATGNGFGLLVANAGSAAVAVTLPVSVTYDGLAVAARSVMVPGGGWQIIPVPSAVYGRQPQHVTYSALKGVTAAVIRIP